MAYMYVPGPDGDPGYIESLRTHTRLAELRRLGLVIAVVPVVAFVAIPLVVHEGETAAWTLVLPVLVAGGAFVAGWQLSHSIPAMPPGLEPGTAGVRAVGVLRRTVFTQLGLAGAALVVALLAALVGGSLLPYALGFLCAWPQLLRALPDRRVIEEVRARLEVQGADSRLWAALAEPVGGAAHRRG